MSHSRQKNRNSRVVDMSRRDDMVIIEGDTETLPKIFDKQEIEESKCSCDIIEKRIRNYSFKSFVKYYVNKFFSLISSIFTFKKKNNTISDGTV